MPAKPSLKARTPDDESTNSLIVDHDDLVAAFQSRTRQNRHIALVEIGVEKVELLEGGGRKAITYLRHIEVLHGDDAVEGERLFTRVYQERTNATGARPHPTEETDTDTPLDGLDDSLEG